MTDTATVLGENGVEEREVLMHKSGILYRKDTCDLFTIRECLKNYADLPMENAVVMDIGANIGAFTSMAISRGARIVPAFEPEFHNFGMLKRNCHLANTVMGFATHVAEIPKAVVGPSETRGQIPLYVGGTTAGPSMASIIPVSGRDVQYVPTIQFGMVADFYKPDIIKVDVEGAEYDFISLIPNFTKWLAIELHGLTKETRPLYSKYLEHFTTSLAWDVVNLVERKFYGRPVADMVLRRK